MEENKLAVLDRKMALRAWPAQDLDRVFDTSLKYFLAGILSLKEGAEEKLDFALPAIRSHFWSMGLADVKKAFEMYVDGQLRTKPKSNYLDRILVGQIFKEYRELRPQPKTPVVTNEEISDAKKADILTAGILRLFNEFEETGEVGPGNTHLYDHLEETGEIQLTPARKWELFEQAKKNNKKSASILDKVVNGPERVVVEAKRLALLDWLNQRKNKGLDGN